MSDLETLEGHDSHRVDDLAHGEIGMRTPISEPRSAPQRRGAAVGWGVALVAAGTVLMLLQLGVPIVWEIVLPIAVILTGAALLLGVRGAARGGLVGLGVVLAVVALVAMTLPTFVFSVDASEIVVRSVTDIAPYEQGAGELHLDLRSLDIPEGRTPVEARLGFGELVVIVPPGVTVVGDARVTAGEVTVFGRTTAGFLPERTVEEAGADTGRILELDLRVGFGRIEVRR